MKRAPHKYLTRLRDDPSVSPVLRGDLARAASDADGGYNVAAGLARFEGSLEAEMGAPAEPAAPAGAAAKPLFSAGVKGFLWGIGAAGIAAATAVALHATSPEKPPRGAAEPIARPAAARASADPAQAPSAEPPEPHRDFDKPEPAPSPPPPFASVRSPRNPSPVESTPPRPELEPPISTAPTPPSTADPLTPEMENLSRVRALEPSHPAEALAVAEEGHRAFPSGVFTQEREALAISALVRVGRQAEARTRAKAFITAYPRSHFIERIRRLTGMEEGR